MDALLVLLDSTVGPGKAQALVLFLFFLPIFFFANWAVKRNPSLILRPIAGFAALKGMLGKSAEAGQPVHLSMGTAGIGDQATADTMASLYVLDYLAERGAISGSPPIVTCAHPTALPVAQDLLRRAHRRQGYAEEFDPARARLIAPDSDLNSLAPANIAQGDAFAYAAGTMRMLDHQKLIANVMLGQFGAEYLLLGETGAQKNITQIGGASDPTVLPLMNATIEHPLIGEEIYAGGAYLSGKPSHIGSLLAQDIMRWMLALGMIGAVLLRTLGGI